MSLDGNFAGLTVTNQACSSGDSGYSWRGDYDDEQNSYACQWYQKKGKQKQFSNQIAIMF